MKLAVKKSIKEISNNLLIYIPVVLFLIYAGNKFYGVEVLKGISLLVPTVLTVFLTVTLTKQVFKKSDNFYDKAFTSFSLGFILGVIFAVITILLSAFNFQFNFVSLFLNALLAGIASAFFTVYDYDNNYKKEYRNIFVTIISLFTFLLFSLFKLTFDINLVSSLILSMVLVFAIFNKTRVRKIEFNKANIIENIKKTVSAESLKQYPKHYMLILSIFLTPYIVLANNGFILAGLTSFMLILSSILFFTWHSVKNNLMLTAHGTVAYNTKKIRVGLIIVIILTLLVSFSFMLFPVQIMNIFTLPADYSNYFGMLGFALLPFTVSMIIIMLFNDVELIRNWSLELTLTAILTFGVLILTRFPQIQLGVSLFILYSIFITWVLIKEKIKAQ